jgi:HSP20 family protein
MTGKQLMVSSPMGRALGLSRFDSLFNDLATKMDELWNSDLAVNAFAELQPKGRLPKVDVKETDDGYEVEILASPFGKEDISLELKDNALFIKADKEESCEDSSDESGCKYLVKEIAHRSFRRIINFPSEIDTQKINTSYKDGVISLTLGKVEEVADPVVKIEIE